MRRSFDEGSSSQLFDDDDGGEDALADSVQSLDQEISSPVPDTQVVQAVEQALNNIMEDSQPPTAEDLRESLFGSDDAGSSLFVPDGDAKRDSIDAQGSDRTEGLLTFRDPPGALSTCNDLRSLPRSWRSLAWHLSASSVPLRVSAFSKITISSQTRTNSLADEREDLEEHAEEEIDVHEAAPGDPGLAEAITVLTNDIDRLVAQDAVVDSLLRKAELTNNMAELRILRKSKASLERELRRKELQRQQYVVQESDNKLIRPLHDQDRDYPGRARR